MATTIIRPKNRAEWLKYREGGIGSSEVGTIVGLNPYETPYQLWRRKKGIDPAKSETFAMKAGHYLEDAVARFWMDETGNEVIKASAGDWIIANKEKPFLRVSPDRTYWLEGRRSNDNKGILECKTTQKSIDEDDIPKYWYCQLQYQLGVAEVRKGSLAWLSQGRDFGYRDYDFNEDIFGWLIESVEKFWQDCILGERIPEAISATDVLLKYNRHTDGKSKEVSDKTYEEWAELKALRKDIDELKKREEELINSIKMVFDDAELISYDGLTLATWKAPKPSEKFDDKAFKADHPDLAAQYIKTSQGARRFLIK